MQFFPNIFDVVSNGFLIGFEFICKVNNNKAQNRLYQPLELPKNDFNTSYFSRKEIWPILEIENSLWKSSVGDFLEFSYTQMNPSATAKLFLFFSIWNTLLQKFMLSVHLLQDKVLIFI